MKNLFKILNKYSFLIVLAAFFLINLWFNYSFYWRLIFDKSNRSIGVGEIKQSEWGTEKIYQKIIHKENPFSSIKKIMYPFDLDIVMSDPGMAFYSLLFRPFLTAQKSLLLTVVIGILLANIGMYLLLRLLGFSKPISFLIGFSFGYTTFLLPKGGHLNYIAAIYVFPWFYFFLYKFVKTNKLLLRFLFLFFTCFIFVLALWQNLYYFIILLLSLFFFFCYFVIFERKKIVRIIFKYYQYIFTALIIIFLLLIPQIKILLETLKFSDSPEPIGWAGAIEFSSDLLNYFIPSIYNYYYGGLLISLTKNNEFIKNIFENFTYPGLIILLSYSYFLFFIKKVSKITKEKIFPFFLISLGFIILSLGPFLHFAGRWWVEIEDGIRLVVPLPFVIIHYLPFLENIRAPGRLIVGFIFFAYIVVAYIFEIILKSKPNKFKILFFILVFIIIIFDQRPMVVKTINFEKKENRIFEIIGKDKEESTLLEIPFGVRDGLTYFGDFDAVTLTLRETIHKKSIIGGYAGRIPNYIKKYYRENAFIGFLGRIIDTNVSKNPFMINDNLSLWKEINKEESLKAIDFLNIKYIVTNDEKDYSFKINKVLESLGYKMATKISNLSLWEKKLEKKEHFPTEIGKFGDELFLGLGWYSREVDFRWSNKRSSIMFKINKKRDINFSFKSASFFRQQNVKVYLNKNKIGKFKISTEINKYDLELPEKYQTEGINTIYFIFDQSIKPSNVIDANLDNREISAKITEVTFIDKQE